MKRNLLTMIVLVLVIVNIILTAILTFSVTGTNKKVANLVTSIATVMELELTPPGQEGEKKREVSLADTAIYPITGSMTIPLASETVVNEKGQTVNKQGYLICHISFSLNTKHSDYKKYGENISEKEELVKDAINTCVSRHTASDLQADPSLEPLKAEILKAVQQLFGSDFIYKVAISEVKFG